MRLRVRADRTAQRVLKGDFAWFEGDVLDPAGDGPLMGDPDELAAKDRLGAATASEVEREAEAVQ